MLRLHSIWTISMCNVHAKSTFYCSSGGQFVKYVLSWGTEIPRLLCRLFCNSFLLKQKWMHLSCWRCSTKNSTSVLENASRSRQCLFMYSFVLIFPLGEHVEHWFLGLGQELCCSSIYGDRRHIAPKWQSALLWYYQLCTFSYGLSVQSYCFLSEEFLNNVDHVYCLS